MSGTRPGCHRLKPSFGSAAGSAYVGAAVAALWAGGRRGGRARPHSRRVRGAAVAGSRKARRRSEGAVTVSSSRRGHLQRVHHHSAVTLEKPHARLSNASHPNHRLSHFLPQQQSLPMQQSAFSLLIVGPICHVSLDMAGTITGALQCHRPSCQSARQEIILEIL